MKRFSYSRYVAKCNAMKKAPVGQDDYANLDDQGYQDATEDMGKAEDDEGDEGGDEGGDEDGGAGDEENDEGGDESEKSQRSLFPGEEELLKACDLVLRTAGQLPAVAKQNRLAELSKSATDGTLTDAQRAEMMELLTPPQKPVASNALAKSLDRPGMQEAIDASEYLLLHAEATVKSMAAFEQELRQGNQQTQGFFGALAKGMDTMAKSWVETNRQQRVLIKSLEDRLEHLERSPLPYRAATQEAPAPTVQKSQILPSPRDGVAVGMLQKASGMSRGQVLGALDRIRENRDDPQYRQAGEAIMAMDLRKSADWREFVTDPDLLRRVVEG